MRMRKCKWIELLTRNDRPHPSQQANVTAAVLYWTIETGMTENRVLHLSLRERLSGQLSMACEPEALGSECISMTTMFVYMALLF